MNKKLLKISIAGMILGSLFLYMSVMGASGFGLSLTGTTFKEDFNAYPGANYWQTGAGSGVWGAPEINPAGQLEMNSPVGGRTGCMASWTLPGLQWTAEFRLKIDQFGAGGTLAQQGVGIYATTYWIPLAIYSDHIQVGAQSISVVTDNAWYVWTLVESGSNFDLYRGSTKLATWLNIAASLTSKISFDGYGGTTTSTLAHFDYIYIDSGLHPPSGGSTYSLTVNAQSGGNSISGMQASVNSDPRTVPYTWSLTSSSVTATIDSTYASGGTTYTFSSWDNGGTSNTRSGTLSAGSNTWTATYTYSSGSLYTVIVLTKDSSGVEISGIPVTFKGGTKNSGSAIWSSVAAGSASLSVSTSYTIGGITYTFSSWKDSVMTGASGTYYVSGTVTLIAYYTASGGGWDPLAGLRSFLNSATVRSYEMMAGAAAVLLSSVLMVAAFLVKKKTGLLPLPFIKNGR